MTEEQRAAVIVARSVTALLRGLGMMSSNLSANQLNMLCPHKESDFLKVIEEEGIHWNAVHKVLYE